MAFENIGGEARDAGVALNTVQPENKPLAVNDEELTVWVRQHSRGPGQLTRVSRSVSRSGSRRDDRAVDDGAVLVLVGRDAASGIELIEGT
jgi:hypothetical protein